MTLLQISPETTVDSENLVKVAFRPSPSAPIGQRADLLISSGGQLVPAVSGEVNSLPALQQLRELIGDGTGATRWVRVRERGSSGDNEDSYVNLSRIGGVDFAEGPDGEVARLTSSDGAEIGEVHLPAALQVVRDLAGS